LTVDPLYMGQSMNSTAVAIYDPPSILNWSSILVSFVILTVLTAIFPKEADAEEAWRYCGMIIDLRGAPGELGKAATEAGVVYTGLYEREYASGKFAWRVKINDKYHYLSRTLVRLKAVPA
jgi:hypothetical protein